MNSTQSRTLGRSGIKVSPMGLGCWAIGGAFKFNGMNDGYGQIDDEISVKAIQRAVVLGITYFDTADAYGTGHSERILGKALKGIRSKVVISTKFGYTYNESSKELLGEDSSAEYIMKACEASLKRLKTDYIDLYQLHRWSIPVEEIDQVIETLEKLVTKGLIRAYGWSTDWVEGASIFAEKSNCAAIQQSFNLFGYEKEILALCEKYDMASINRSPLYKSQATQWIPKKSTCRSRCLYRMPDYLTTLALPPDISFSTSFKFAMEVSPGVVMAKAPCAAP